MGIIRIARATAPATAEKRLVGLTMNVQPTMPMTIDGVPLSTSAMKRTSQPSRPEPYSARYIPAPTPSGTPMIAARPTTMPVPTMALATPPPLWPAGTGLFVKNAQSRDDAPLMMRLPRIRNSASTAVNDSTMTRPVMMRLVMWRRSARVLIGPGSRRPARARPAKSDAGDGVHDHGEDEQDEADLEQGGQVQVGRRL